VGEAAGTRGETEVRLLLMPENREAILELLKHAQSVTDRNLELFEECDKAFQAIQPELQALANRAAELLFDEEYKTRLQGWMSSVAQKQYQSSVDKLFAEAFPAYGKSVDLLGDYLDEIREDVSHSEKFDSAIGPLKKCIEQHRQRIGRKSENHNESHKKTPGLILVAE
jgi:hypothetical protein